MTLGIQHAYTVRCMHASCVRYFFAFERNISKHDLPLNSLTPFVIYDHSHINLPGITSANRTQMRYRQIRLSHQAIWFLPMDYSHQSIRKNRSVMNAFSKEPSVPLGGQGHFFTYSTVSDSGVLPVYAVTTNTALYVTPLSQGNPPPTCNVPRVLLLYHSST